MFDQVLRNARAQVIEILRAVRGLTKQHDPGGIEPIGQAGHVASRGIERLRGGASRRHEMAIQIA